MTRHIFGKNSNWFVFALIMAISAWFGVAVNKVYSTNPEPQIQQQVEQITPYQNRYKRETYKPKPALKTKKIRAGLYEARVIQPLTLFNTQGNATIVYMIAKASDGKAWVATRTAVFGGNSFDLGADTFRTKGDAVSYIDEMGRYIDYGRQANIEALYYE